VYTLITTKAGGDFLNVSKDVAQSIVEEMKKIINQDINYFDTKSIIIASTDISRIGNYHGGAKRVLEQNSDLIISYNEQYEGAKKGINVPVYFENEIVGVIGITGEKNEVEKYGKIIQRMTEILIKEAYILEQENIERESKRQFIEELLFRSRSDEKALIMRGDLLNIKTDIPRVVIISKLLDNEDREVVLAPSINEKTFNSFRNRINYDAQNLIVQSGTNIIMILKVISKNSIDGIINSIKNDVDKYCNLSIFWGIGDISNNFKEIKRSYKEAKKALNLAVAFQNNKTQYYKDLDIGLLIDDIPKENISKYNKKIFGELTKEQIAEYADIIDAFTKYNGSITKTSEELFIHKNTLQYRLNKLKSLTGYDPRIIDEMVVLYLAFTFYKLGK
jgi:carbohydrate diacid regulator